ncbi:MAG: hypothetical protein V4649_00085 [Bacteroidota bacterium]
MKRVLIFSALVAIAFASCKKKVSQVSTIVTASYPTITISTPQFISIPVGGALPDANAIVATAYDSFYHESLGVVVDASKLSNLNAGLYTVTISAKNKYGYIGYENVYVAVTDVHDTVDVSGLYYRDEDPKRPAFVTKVARGLFHTTNLGGVDTTGQPATILHGYFAVLDNTTIDLGMQSIPGSTFTAANVITGTYGALDLVSIPKSYSYAFSDQMGLFGTGIRSFYKQ